MRGQPRVIQCRAKGRGGQSHSGRARAYTVRACGNGRAAARRVMLSSGWSPAPQTQAPAWMPAGGRGPVKLPQPLPAVGSTPAASPAPAQDSLECSRVAASRVARRADYAQRRAAAGAAARHLHDTRQSPRQGIAERVSHYTKCISVRFRQHNSCRPCSRRTKVQVGFATEGDHSTNSLLPCTREHHLSSQVTYWTHPAASILRAGRAQERSSRCRPPFTPPRGRPGAQ